MSSTFDEFQLMLYHHPFDIITLSETWLRSDANLLQYVQIPGYNFCYKNWDERRGGGVGIDIKDTIKYKERQKPKQTRRNYRTYVERVSREEQKQRLLCRCFPPTSSWRQRKTDMDSNTRYDTFSKNNNFEQNHRNCRRYQHWLK